MSDSTQPRSDETLEILLVEDNPGDARLTQEAFKMTERETTLHFVTDGDDAVDFLNQQGSHEMSLLPDLVLLDLNLPGRDGCEVLEAIRTTSQIQYLPVIMLTSSTADEDIAKCYTARANAYLTKPTDPDVFVEVVDAIEQFWFEQVQLPPVPA
jgi:CheY-like chemotaxis protein